MGFRGMRCNRSRTRYSTSILQRQRFNVEGTQVTIYHGKVMQLRVTNLIVPSASSIRLSDGHKQDTPLTLLTSGKKTDAPVLAATCLIRKERRCTSAHTSKMQRPTMLTICYLNCFTKKTTTMNKTIIICLWVLFLCTNMLQAKSIT